jgi:uncharacterized protein (AIM24 family)
MEYKISGQPMPALECSLKEGESLITQTGAMIWMTENITMNTSIGGGALRKIFGRPFLNTSIFQTWYEAKNGPGMVAFGMRFAGIIKPIEITEDRPIVCQRGSFLVADANIGLSIFFQKKIGVGLFGGEGFIMQKMAGQGMAFIEIDGSAVEYILKEGETIVIDPGHLAMMDATCSLDIVMLNGVKNILFGNEDLFRLKITGPGNIVLQTMTLGELAGALSPYFVPRSR